MSARPDLPGAPVAVSSWRRGLRRIGPLLAISTIYFGMLVYPPLRIIGLSFPDWQPDTPALLAIMVGPVAARLLCEWLAGAVARAVAALVMTWLGTCFIAFCVVVPWELANLLWNLLGASGTLGSPAWGLALAGTTLALTGYGAFNAQRLTTRRVSVPAPASVRGTRLVQISDVHVGSRSGRFLRRVVRRANRCDADYVLITGDLIDFHGISERELSSLADLRAPAYFIIGNHERYVDLEPICQRLRNLGVRVLRNESIELGNIQLVGIDDAEPKTQVGRVLPHIPALPDLYRIVLYHRPDGARDAAAWGASLMLCGHTHNGQIVPFNYLVRRVFPRICGLYQVDDLHLYVSPGTGTWGPLLRLGSRCEIGMIELD